MSLTEPIRVLMIEDHIIMRAGLRMYLETQADIQVIGEADNRHNALELCAREKPDITLLDLVLGDDNGVSFLPELVSSNPDGRIIVLTGGASRDVYSRVIALGVTGIVLKDQATEVLLKAIRRVHAGDLWLERSLLADTLVQMSQPRAQPLDPEITKIASLTEREREVIALIGEGLKNKAIAARLFVSETTVRHHLTSIFSKLDLNDRLELVIYAYRHRLLELPKPPS